jgi:hypothetical protein
MTLLWFRKERGPCTFCGRQLGRRSLTHFIEPPPWCLDGTRQCKQTFYQRMGIPE